MHAPQGARRAAISAVVTRADGRVEDLGVISYFDEDPRAQARYEAARAAGRRVGERELFVPDRRTGTVTFHFGGSGIIRP